jgi:iron complex outermembrane receptor protein
MNTYRGSGARLAFLAGTMIATGVATAQAHAQTQAPPAAPAAAPTASADTQSTGVAEVIVTAQRRAERAQTVPVTVTALSSKDLAKNSIVDVSRLEFVVPGFVLARTGSDSRPSLRGVRTEAITAAADPTIGFYIDGVYQSRPAQGTMPLVDVQRVEVQEGPQGTLYGRNSYGGNIAVTNNQPSNHYEAGLTAEVGNYDLYRGTGYINLPINDDLQVRGAFLSSTQKGYVTSPNNPEVALGGENDEFFRGSAKWTPTDNFTAVFTTAYWRRTGQGAASGYKVIGTLIDPNTGLRSSTGVPYAVNPSVVSASDPTFVHGVNVGVPVSKNPWVTDFDYKPWENTHDFYQTLDLNYRFGDFATLHSITGYSYFRTDRTWDVDFSGVVFPAPGVTSFYGGSGIQRVDSLDHAFSEELQLASQSAKPLQWIAGLYYLNDQIDEANPYIYYTSPTATAADTVSFSHVKLNAYAAFAQASYFLLPDTLRITGGVRYTQEEKAFLNQNYLIPETAGVASKSMNLISAGGGSPVFDRATYHAGLDYFVTKRSMLYFSFSTGYESGGFNNNAASSSIPATYGPQTVTAFELGSKNTFFDRKLQLNLALFDNEYRSLQLQFFDPASGLTYISNAGAAVGRGVEVSSIWEPIRGLRFDAGVSILDAHFTQYIRPNLFSGPGEPKTVNLAGNEIPMSPKLKTTVSASYDIDANGWGVFTPFVAWTHSSHYFGQDQNYILDRQDAFEKVDLAVAWSPENREDLTIRAYVNNLTNVAQLERAVYGADQRAQVGYGPPREFGMSVSKKFN